MKRQALKLAMLGLLLAAHPALADGVNHNRKAPQHYLEFLDQQDATCYNLSQGGRLHLLKNTHPSQRIRFRLLRYFIHVKQPGLVQGIIEPKDKPIELGCTLVDGRKQWWEIYSASFVE